MPLRLKNNLLPGYIALLILLSSCDLLFKETAEKYPLARVGNTFLYKEDIASLVQENTSPEDSTLLITNHINNWAAKRLLLAKAKINLPEEKLKEFDRLVKDYQAELYTRAYVEALVLQAQDTAVNPEELKAYYEKEKENFKLHEKLVQLYFVALPSQFLHKEEIKEKIKNWQDPDKAYLDSIAVQFKKIHFNDSIWVSAARVMEAIPPLTPYNEEHYLKKSQFFELQDSLTLYLGKVTHVLEINDTAPFSYITPDIKQLILNKRRLNHIKKLEAGIIEEAIKTNVFEVYEQKTKKNTDPDNHYSKQL